MEQQSDKPTVLFMLAVMAFAIILVDDVWVRTGLGLLPGLLLAQRALLGVGVGEKATSSPRTAERRVADRLRRQTEELLTHLRDFYSVCHRVGQGDATTDEAEELASGLERRLNVLLAEVKESARSAG